jgi:chromosome segregation ATPase
MSPETLQQAATVAGSAATGAVATGWLVKFLVTKFVRDNEKKHEATDKSLKEISKTLETIAKEIAVISTVLGQVAALKEQIAKDHDTVIELKTWNTKHGADLRAQFGKIRDIEHRFEDVSNLISGMRGRANE